MNPIFDEVLADSDPDIFLASNIFPNPTVTDTESLLSPWPEILEQGRFDFLTGAFVPHPIRVQTFAPEFREHIWPDPANLSFLRSVA